MHRLVAASVAFAAVALTAAQDLPPVPTLQPWQTEGIVRAQQSFASQQTLVNPSGLKRADYLQTIQGSVDYWKTQQTAAGQIVDPATGIEEQYATPCFAWSAATVVANLGRSDLLPNASAALSFALNAMLNGSTAQATADFYAVPVLNAFLTLSPLVDTTQQQQWQTQLSSFDPNKTYEFTGQNWELTAAAGEYIRIVTKQFPSAGGWTWNNWEARIGRLATVGGVNGGFWDSSNGMFQDNFGQAKTSPQAYDAFGDAYTSLLLKLGYNSTGVYAPYLGPMMERAIWTHLSFQTPFGEIPVGGRSGQHQWTEAVMAAISEIYAGYALEAGNTQQACMLVRAARMYHSSLRRWIRSEEQGKAGSIQIVKNWFLDPTQRWGYEGYSFYSQYNLLPMAWLSNAYLYSSDATDALGECAGMLDVGGTVFALEESTFRRAYASVAGTYIELMFGADEEYDTVGFYRLQMNSCAMKHNSSSASAPCFLNSLLGPTAAAPINVSPMPLSIGGLWWTLQGDTRTYSLANNTLQTVLGAIVTPLPLNSPAFGVGFTAQYILWNDGAVVTETYMMQGGVGSETAGGLVNVTSQLSFPGYPAMLHMLADAAATRVSERCKNVNTVAADGTPVIAEGCSFYMAPFDKHAAQAVRDRDLAALLAVAPAARYYSGPEDAAAPVLQSFGIHFPVLTFDGLTNFTVVVPTAENPTLLVSPPAGTAAPGEGALQVNIVVPPGHNATFNLDNSLWAPSRNGVVVPLIAELGATTSSPAVMYSVQLVPAV
jgi:hypothetical protein